MVDRPGNWNIRPLQSSFTSLTNSASHFPTNTYNTAFKAFLLPVTLTSGASHFGTISTYQYLTQAFYTLSRTTDETTPIGDDLTTYWTKNFEEPITLVDFDFLGISYQNEEITITDELIVTIISVFEETFNVGDSLTKSIATSEPVIIYDDVTISWTKYFTELINVSDLAAGNLLDTATYGMTVAIQEAPPPYYSLTITNEVYDSQIGSFNVGILPMDLPALSSIAALPSASNVTPVVAVSGYNVPIIPSPVTSASANPFYSTVILHGVTYASNPQTAYPGTPNVNTNFVQWLNAQIGNVNTCSLLNFDVELDYSGGSFNFSTLTDPGYGLGDTIDLWGLNGTVTEKGKIYSNGQVGVEVSGILGNRNLNKQLNVLAAGSPVLFSYLTNSLLSTQQENSLKTFGGAARAIAQIAGCNLGVNFPTGDIPLVDFTVQEGETAIAALSSIASQFGGGLLWNGGNSYLIVPPNVFRGRWDVPNQSILTGSGAKDANKLDLSTGAFGTGFYSVPIEKYFDPSVYGLPNTIPQSSYPQVQKVATLSKLLTTDDPPFIVDLPLDTSEGYIQILVKPGTPFGASRYVTDDESQWFSVGSPSIANGIVRLVNKGGALGAVVPQMRIDPTLFPSIDAINNGQFIMSLGVTRNDNGALFEAAVNSRDQQIRNLMTKLLNSFRFVETYSGSISSYFFGSVPLPGMWASAPVCGEQVEGIIQSVSFTYPGIVSVQVAQFTRINFLQNFYHLDLLNPQGIN